MFPPIAQRVARYDRPRVRDMTIEALLTWTFGAQKAQLDDGSMPEVWTKLRNHGTEWVILQRHMTGCVIDGGKGYIPDSVHQDADVVAAVVSGVLPRQMAIRVAELAAVGRCPDWMPGAVPRCLPRKVVTNRHGTFAEVIEALPSIFTGGVWRPEFKKRKGRDRYEGYVCPVIYEPRKQRIDSARQDYREWWAAIYEVRQHLLSGELMKEHRLVGGMPEQEPWSKECSDA